MIYKLSFINEDKYLAVYDTLLVDGVLPKGVTMFIKQHLSYPAVLNEMGEVVTEGGLYDDFAVDCYSPIVLPQLNEYIMLPKATYRHNISGVSNDTIVVATPTMEWAKLRITQWLTANDIGWLSSMNKTELLALC